MRWRWRGGNRYAKQNMLNKLWARACGAPIRVRNAMLAHTHTHWCACTLLESYAAYARVRATDICGRLPRWDVVELWSVPTWTAAHAPRRQRAVRPGRSHHLTNRYVVYESRENLGARAPHGGTVESPSRARSFGRLGRLHGETNTTAHTHTHTNYDFV